MLSYADLAYRNLGRCWMVTCRNELDSYIFFTLQRLWFVAEKKLADHADHVYGGSRKSVGK